MEPLSSVLVCFAVKEEAGPFERRLGAGAKPGILITGVGRKNARSKVEAALQAEMPKILLTCGFAGGLRPELAGGTVLFDVEKSTGLEGALLSAHAQRGRFHCAERVAATAEEKRALWKSTGADAVEMESQIIRSLCQDRTIPSGTVRVILDTAGEDLPLDFNQLMTSDQSMDYRRLLWTVLRRPAKIKALLHLRRQSEAAADRLAEVLSEILPHAR